MLIKQSFQSFKKHWTNISKKPDKFKFIMSNIYEYEIGIIGPDSNKSVYKEDYFYHKELIPVLYYCDGLDKKINTNVFYEHLSKLTGIEIGTHNSILNIEMFKRDSDIFPFVDYIELVYTETAKEYLIKRDLRQRINKIKKIKSKI